MLHGRLVGGWHTGQLRGSPDGGPTHLHYTKDLMEQLIIFLPLLVIMGAFMFFASRRQKRAMQATIDLHESLRVGDRVHTTSGLQATIAGITDDTVDLEIAPGVITTWMKLAIRDRVERDIDDDDEITAEADEPGRLTQD